MDTATEKVVLDKLQNESTNKTIIAIYPQEIQFSGLQLSSYLFWTKV